jgi:hypothetical protein
MIGQFTIWNVHVFMLNMYLLDPPLTTENRTERKFHKLSIWTSQKFTTQDKERKIPNFFKYLPELERTTPSQRTNYFPN